MARKTKIWTVDTPGRDKGKGFLITEMSADKAERWALKALLALANGGAKLPDGVLDAGMAGIASMAGAVVLSLRHLQGTRYEDVAELLDEMMECVRFQPPGTTSDGLPLPSQMLFEGDNCQIEEVSTRIKLRWEVLQVHVDFSVADALSSLTPSTAPVPASA